MSLSPYDRASALCPNDAAKLELARLGAELGLSANSEEWIVVVLYGQARRLFGQEEAARINENHLRQLETATIRLETTIAKLDHRPENIKKLQLRFPPLVGIVAIGMLIALTSWFAGASVAASRIHFAEQHVATMLTTPAGSAALGILNANGDQLPQNLTRCKILHVGGRNAQDCVLWRDGPSPFPQRGPFWAVTLVLTTLPAWPFAGLSFATLTIASVLATMKTGPRIRQI